MIDMIFKAYRIIFLILVCGTLSYGADMSNLGHHIRNDIFVPIQNLGSRISTSMKEKLGFVPSEKIDESPYRFLVIQDSSSSRFSNQPGLGLDDLGQQIEESAYKGIEPIWALDTIAKMKGGVGGVTIATYLPEGKKILIRHHQASTCSELISETTGYCSGILSPVRFENKRDYCYNPNGNSIVNDKICFGINSVSVVDNVVKCETFSGTPAVMMTVEEYNNMCRGLSDTVEYRYIANSEDPDHIKIPNANKYVRCNNNQVGVCVFSESRLAERLRQRSRLLPQNSNDYLNDLFSTNFLNKSGWRLVIPPTP